MNSKHEALLLTIGDELLVGQVIDTNSAWIATELNTLGIRVQEIRSIPDETEAIISTLNEVGSRFPIIISTGGLGPTKDDITKKAIARWFQSDLVFHEETYERLVVLLTKYRVAVTELHRHQAKLPSNAKVLNNGLGTAPGMWFDLSGGGVFVSLPGVPFEMKYLMTEHVLPRLKNGGWNRPILHSTILTVGIGESDIAKRIVQIERDLPAYISLSYLPGKAQVRVRLSHYAPERNQAEQELEQWTKAIIGLIPEVVYGFGDSNLETEVGDMLRKSGLTLGLAESCTGGFVGHKITEVPGSSDYFKGSMVTYSNEAKMNILGVTQETLTNHGAVSEQTVREMATGALRVLNTDIAISISGIAGPGGGSAEKPVGTIWLALTDGQTTKTRKLELTKNRLLNIEYTATLALNLLRKFLLEV